MLFWPTLLKEHTKRCCFDLRKLKKQNSQWRMEAHLLGVLCMAGSECLISASVKRWRLQSGKVLKGGIALLDTLGAPFTTMGATIVVEIIIASPFHIVVSFVSKAKVFHVFVLPKIQEKHLSLS